MKGVVCICSRGLLHSRMMESVDLEIRQGWKKLYSHDLPIPEAQNDIVGRALELDPDFLWFVEEDIVVPEGILKRLIDARSDIAVATYKLEGGLMSHRMLRNRVGVAFAGLGCTLIRRSCFDRLEKPYFRTDMGYELGCDDEPVRSRYEHQYGGQDVQFFMRTLEKGMHTEFVDIECRHLYVKKYGRPKTNNGCHVIEDR